MAGINPRKVVGGVVDLVVYAPVGIAATVIEELPGLVEKGKSRLTMARTIGQFAVAMGRQRVEKAIADRRGADRPAEDTTTSSAGGSPEGAAPEGPVSHDHHESGAVAGRGDQHGHSDTGGARPDGLAIPGYDSLAASQVVQRLAGLSLAELEAVREYEEATRGRRTILGRIAQLTATQGDPEGE